MEFDTPLYTFTYTDGRIFWRKMPYEGYKRDVPIQHGYGLYVEATKHHKYMGVYEKIMDFEEIRYYVSVRDDVNISQSYIDLYRSIKRELMSRIERIG